MIDFLIGLVPKFINLILNRMKKVDKQKVTSVKVNNGVIIHIHIHNDEK